MTENPTPPVSAGPPRGGGAAPPWAALALSFLCALAALPRPAAAAPLGFGETRVVSGCLHISATAYRGRQGDFDNQDWVTMEIRNRCETSLRHLLVELRLIDAQGNFYGRRIWLLGRREALRPGGRRTERYAIPDPDGRIAIGWEIKVLKLERAPGAPARRK